MNSYESHVDLAATPHKALACWDVRPDATILVNRSQTLYVIGLEPAVWIGHRDWQQTSPEELDALIASDIESRRP